MINEILDRDFRANPAYKLVAYDRLPDEERKHLQTLAGDGDFYGVLVGQGSPKAVDPETALLFLSLQDPGVIPTYVRQKFGRSTNRAIAELVLDDILQIAAGDTYCSGTEAHAVIFVENGGREMAVHPLGRLAVNALRYAQRLPAMSTAQLAHRIYMYNTIPSTFFWQDMLADETAVSSWLGINGWMKRSWQQQPPVEGGGWLSWRLRGNAPEELPYKLYISPRPQALAKSFRPIVETLARHRVPSFKVGKNAQGILRPDKLVSYLPDFASVAAVARDLQELLAGSPAQGVPFTAPIDAAGLLSWGMDPPQAAQVFAAERRESWRFWIIERLAAALQTAVGNNENVAPWQYALDRLQLEGIDTERWTPNQNMWERWTAAPNEHNHARRMIDLGDDNGLNE